MNAHLIEAASPETIAQIQALFVDYAASLGFSLCFQGFDQELASLPGAYSPPRGSLLLLLVDQQPAGCVAVRPLGETVCEMKRLYIDPVHRGRHLGRLAAQTAIDQARLLGYRTMLLDTIGTEMAAAVALYESLGFKRCDDYNANPIPGATHMRLTL